MLRRTCNGFFCLFYIEVYAKLLGKATISSSKRIFDHGLEGMSSMPSVLVFNAICQQSKYLFRSQYFVVPKRLNWFKGTQARDSFEFFLLKSKQYSKKIRIFFISTFARISMFEYFCDDWAHANQFFVGRHLKFGPMKRDPWRFFKILIIYTWKLNFNLGFWGTFWELYHPLAEHARKRFHRLLSIRGHDVH